MPKPRSAVRTVEHQTLNIGIVCSRRCWPACYWRRTGFRSRIAAVAAIIMLLMLLGVFWPTLSQHIYGPTFTWSVIIVTVLWIASAPFIFGSRLRRYNQAINTTWSTCGLPITRCKPPPSAPTLRLRPHAPQDPTSENMGGPSHE